MHKTKDKRPKTKDKRPKKKAINEVPLLGGARGGLNYNAKDKRQKTKDKRQKTKDKRQKTKGDDIS